MKIINGSVFLEDGKFQEATVACMDGKITEISTGDALSANSSEAGEEIIDATDCYVIPGLCDIHLHGCMSYDACDGTKEALKEMAKYEAAHGVTSILPTTMTYPEDTLTTIANAVRDYRIYDNNTPGHATIHGINMEGPFISPEKKGAQNPKYIQRCDINMFHRINLASGGAVRLCDIAPEMDGAMEFIDEARKETRISIAHTTADYDTCKQAFDRGARHLTHLFNAMPPFTHRAPGPRGAGDGGPDGVAQEQGYDGEDEACGAQEPPAALAPPVFHFDHDRVADADDEKDGCADDDTAEIHRAQR